ncbi:GNAT acetyltransferase 2-domain-containing protein [Polychytrium aggregatum]|uniref:GNAT acetyltransferase 2-domain-containing protein n=1 Tax=Polychytrium aggregatum TaxID=110093 RepID=UPI0022FDED62|nr:GNAT acetyltransferase 2-domain-containing protein [Polychytrium aggregatum]KAI9205764.1 GNAT acetyltransferase 2-domain-containing protein [Polychytrium aggregatum]
MSNLQRKKLDSRIPALIQNGVQKNHRSFFVVVGDRGKDQVVTLHFLLSKARVSARPNVLWCYKKDLGFSSHRQKRMKQIKSQIARGIKDPDQDDPFELFVSSTSIRYAYYKETEKILGNTYGMCILQDFEAITPNLLARTIETVEGGGIVVLLLRTMTSLKQLYTLTMDVHSRYRTESQHETVARFNERFILSLATCDTCLVVDDELNVLPLSAGKHVKPLPRREEEQLTPEQQELKELKASLADTQPVGSLVGAAKTLDQAKAILTFVEAIAEKTLRSTVTLTASRGRGKSAALGLSIAAAIAYGYSNIFITSPSPENLKTLFEFVFKGFDALGYEEHLDYDIIQSTNPEFQKAVVRVNVFKDHRQTIQYIQPTDHNVLSQAELVIIDEAAAIPLPLVKNLLGPYLVFMASTINGYEGTGRSLSLKLIQQLREQSRGFSEAGENGVVVGRDGKQKKETGPNAAAATASAGGRSLREIKLDEPIRYSSGDSVESWLNKLLCLDCSTPSTGQATRVGGCPHPSKCELYYVNRDTLFSYHPVSEAFLQRMMSLYVASHYKNSPNDLQLLSDAPAHHLFVLLPPIDEGKTTTLPEPLCVIQVCLEGNIAKGTALSSLARGVRQSGDLIPWVVAQQFQDDDFASLSGARVVRVATHPDYTSMGYGGRALELLEKYYRGEVQSLDEDADMDSLEITRVSEAELQNATLQTDEIRVRDPATMPPLLLTLSQRPPKEHLHWLGVSYGVTASLHKFWKRCGFSPVYLRQTANDLTGEHTCIMLKTIHRAGSSLDDVMVERNDWLGQFTWDFRKRFLELLSYQFRKFSPVMVMGVLESAQTGDVKRGSGADAALIRSQGELYRHFTPFDLKRLDSYAQNLLDYHVILDMLHAIAKQYFLGQLNADLTVGVSEDYVNTTQAFKDEATRGVKLSAVQSAILVGMGLQKKTVEDLEAEISLPVSQILALFAKIIRKVSAYYRGVLERDAEEEVEAIVGQKPKRDNVATNAKRRDVTDEAAWDPTQVTLGDDLETAGNEAMEKFKAKQKEIINGIDLAQYAIGGTDEEWSSVKVGSGSGIVSIKNPESTKKRKLTSGTASEMASKVKGEKTGIYDPKNLMAKGKNKVKGRGK